MHSTLGTCIHCVNLLCAEAVAYFSILLNSALLYWKISQNTEFKKNPAIRGVSQGIYQACLKVHLDTENSYLPSKPFFHSQVIKDLYLPNQITFADIRLEPQSTVLTQGILLWKVLSSFLVQPHPLVFCFPLYYRFSVSGQLLLFLAV